MDSSQATDRTRQTKIVCTIGPASSSPEAIRELMIAGMNVARLNFSHGSHADHSKVLNNVREQAKLLGKSIAVFQDLCGPKVRIAEFEKGEINLASGSTIELRHYEGKKSTSEVIYVEAFDPAEVMRAGEKALMADGQIELIAISADSKAVVCKVLSGGVLRSRSGIAVPDSKLNLPCLTDKDLVDLQWAIENDVDYIALSFVRTEKDVLELREKIRAAGKDIPIIAKIERAKAIESLTDIVRTSDAIMIARGDLGMELPIERVPAAQKLIIDECLIHGTPVITATQMLRTMVNESRPTRAEVSDVFTAVRDGTDAVMLSEETAVGKYPSESVRILDRICLEAEKESLNMRAQGALASQETTSVPDSICFAACNAAAKLHASGIVVCTNSGRSTRLIAKYRPRFPIYAATGDEKVMNRLALVWGIEPVKVDLTNITNTEEEVTVSLVGVREKYGVKPGARVVVTVGLRTNKAGATNILQVREIPRNS
jgi:pyruvate kinase